ncbi:MAG: radical SAM protein [Lentisphaeria bacterium]|nr:radical SAM protein [Lentisphaeria bacterium]
MLSENIYPANFDFYPFAYLGEISGKKYPTHRFIVTAADRNSDAKVEYTVDYTLFCPHFYNVSLYPRQWEGRPDRFQNFLSRETNSRIDFKLLIRSCFCIFSKYLVIKDPLAVTGIRGEYTRTEYRQKKNHGFSRKTRIYRYVLSSIVDGENCNLHEFPENNLLILSAKGNFPDHEWVLKEFAAYSAACDGESSDTISDRQIAPDIFAVPLGERYGYADLDLQLLYAPLTGASSITTARELEQNKEGSQKQIAAFQTDVLPQKLPETPEEYFSCIIIPTSSCNFSCSYCYAARGHNNTRLSEESLLAALKFLTGTPRKKYTLLFSGGGEPLLCKKLIYTAAAFLKTHSGNAQVNITVNTNGSLIDRETARYFRENGIHPAVSFEILEELQNRHRSHYQTVKDNIKLLISENVIPSVISTLTPESVSFLPQMAVELRTEFPQVKYWTAEMATLPELSPVEMENFHARWLEGYFEALKIFSGGSRKINCAFEQMMQYPRYRRCRGKLVLTPTGKITICPLTTSPGDPLWNDEQYGKVDNDSLTVDQKKFSELIHDADLESSPCRSCFLKWNCAGGCHNQNHLFSQDIRKLYCRTAREFGLRYILEQTEQFLQKTYSKTLSEHIRQLIGSRGEQHL